MIKAHEKVRRNDITTDLLVKAQETEAFVTERLPFQVTSRELRRRGGLGRLVGVYDVTKIGCDD